MLAFRKQKSAANSFNSHAGASVIQFLEPEIWTKSQYGRSRPVHLEKFINSIRVEISKVFAAKRFACKITALALLFGLPSIAAAQSQDPLSDPLLFRWYSSEELNINLYSDGTGISTDGIRNVTGSNDATFGYQEGFFRVASIGNIVFDYKHIHKVNYADSTETRTTVYDEHISDADFVRFSPSGKIPEHEHKLGDIHTYGSWYAKNPVLGTVGYFVFVPNAENIKNLNPGDVIRSTFKFDLLIRDLNENVLSTNYCMTDLVHCHPTNICQFRSCYLSLSFWSSSLKPI